MAARKPSPPGKVARASPTSARRMRALPLPMGEVPLKGAERANFTLSVGFAASSPIRGAKRARSSKRAGRKPLPRSAAPSRVVQRRRGSE